MAYQKTKEIGLLFTPDNRNLVRANLKTETRRVAKPKCSVPGPFLQYREKEEPFPWYFRRHDGVWDSFATADELADYYSPYGGKGKPIRYYLLEPTQVIRRDGLIGVEEKAKGMENVLVSYLDNTGDQRWLQISAADVKLLDERKDWTQPTSAMFMLKSFARTWFTRERLWVERLGGITRESALAEGIREFSYTAGELSPFCPMDDDRANELAAVRYGTQKLALGVMDAEPVAAYRRLWNSINRKKHPWDDDMWVWCVRFKLEGWQKKNVISSGES